MRIRIAAVDRPAAAILMATPFGSGFYNTIACEYELASFLQLCFFNHRHVTREKVRKLHENAMLHGSMYPYASLLTGFLDSNIFKSLPTWQRRSSSSGADRPSLRRWSTACG